MPVLPGRAVVQDGLLAVVVVAVAVVAVTVTVTVVNRETDMKTKSSAQRLPRMAFGIALTAGFLAFAPAAYSQAVFATPAAATDALVDGIARSDEAKVKTVLGADYKRYIPDSASAYADQLSFLEAWSRGHKIIDTGNGKAMLEVGTNGWTLPIPLVQSASGWRFNTRAAPAEMRTRRVGRNELAAIQVALAYTDAQEEYFAKDPDGKATKHFALRVLSSPGKRDGLYWASLPGEAQSPLGPDFADARPGTAYHGYLYRLLTAQGKDAPGGAKSYMRNGLMTDGYALIAWPVRYGDTGVMSFIVNRDGVVYQKNLGPGTDAAARKVTTYNPDASWTKVQPAK
jgi:hypothetical protein